MSQQRYEVVRGLVLAFSAYQILAFGGALSEAPFVGVTVSATGPFGLMMTHCVLFVLICGVAGFSGFVSVTAQSRGWVLVHLAASGLYFLTLSGFEIHTFINVPVYSLTFGIIVALGILQMLIALVGCICATFYLRFVSSAAMMGSATSLVEPLISDA
jgi:hypothetical protein